MTHNIQCVELGRLSVPGMRITVRLFPAGSNDTKVWRASSNILSFSRVVGDAVQQRDVMRHASSFRPAGPLTFRPRAAVWESRENDKQILAVSAYFDNNFDAAANDMQPDGMPVDDFSMLEMMQLLHDEVRMPGLATQEMVSAIGKILQIKLARLISQQTRSPSSRKPCSSVDAAIIHGLINTTGQTNQRGFPTTAEMAAQFNTSRRSLLRLFKATTGTSPSRYVEEAKVDSAKTLLATTKKTMKQIAYEAGYATASHFSTKFRQFTGLTPSAFRNRARRQNDLSTQHASEQHEA